MKSCAQITKEAATLEKMRELAKKSALLDGYVYILFKREDGSYSYVPEEMEYSGVRIELIYPY